jgi:hypothetical protein
MIGWKYPTKQISNSHHNKNNNVPTKQIDNSHKKKTKTNMSTKQINNSHNNKIKHVYKAN